MKKFLVLGLLALGLALLTDRPANAWINSKFSVGFNWHWQSGGNSLLWGAFRNSQPPGPDNGGGGYGPAMPYGGHGATFPGFTPYGPNDFQWFGNQKPGGANPNDPNAAPAPAPAAASAAQQQAYGTVPTWNGQNPYQAVNYAPNYYGYTNTGYGYPSTGAYYPGYYGYYQAPSYWYGR